jgi:hypothetical protein
MDNKRIVNDYINQCIDGAIVLKKHFPKQTSRVFWLQFKDVFSDRARISKKLISEVVSILESRRIDDCKPMANEGLSFTIELSKMPLTPDQAARAFPPRK